MSDPDGATQNRSAKPVPANSVSHQIDRHEKALLRGDLSDLSGAERKEFYKSVCDSIGLNPLTKPLEYIYLNGDLTLYANKTAAAQLRQNLSISITDLDISREEGLHVVYAYAQDETARTDVDAGIVSINGKSGEGLANARMKAITKSKRRVTLSICGLGFLDETEVDDIPDEAKKEANVRQGSGQLKPRKPDRWYEQAREWMVGKVQEGAADASQFLSNADKVPSDHPLDEWPQEIAEHTISQIKQASASRQSQQAEEPTGQKTASAPSAAHDPSPAHPEGARYTGPQDALQSNFDTAWTHAQGNENLEAISDAQLKRMFAIADENNWDEAALNRLVKDELGYESKRNVPYGDPYDEICEALEDERLRYHMSRDPDTNDMFAGKGLEQDAKNYEQADGEGDANHPEFEGANDDLPF
jgi:hypothetical protein